MNTIATILHYLPLILAGVGLLALGILSFAAYYIYRRMG